MTSLLAPDSSPPLVWSDLLLLGYPALDAMHSEFVECVSALQAASGVDVPIRLETVAAHLSRHFAQEDRWMLDTMFPPRDCHIDEHAAVLESLAQVQQQVSGGNLDAARHLAAALADWFPRHTAHLDSALSHWMCKQRWNAKPVVVRRNVVARE
jgi:hemerythrin